MPRRSALAVALAVGMGLSGLAFGQATTGALFGTAPAGDTVQVVSDSGFTRTATVGDNGQFTFGNLPLGNYTVTLRKDGQTMATKSNVLIQVGGGVSVSFGGSAANAQNFGTVQVTANALPTIDVTTVHNSTVITSEQLRKLPLGHNGTAIALLTPGTMSSDAFGGGINFGGSSIAENAYYVNGYNTGDPYRNEFFFELPYGAIAQQQTLAGGFGAKYGRSDGGVISQIGKRGSNDLHFGAQIRWSPRFLQASAHDTYRPYITLPTKQFCVPILDPNDPSNTQCDPTGAMHSFSHDGDYRPGTMISDNSDDGGWSTTYTGYVGGALIKDKLFIFIDVAYSESASSAYGSLDDPSKSFSSAHSTKYYGKIDWNIDENNIVEFTYLGNHGNSGQGITYHVDPTTRDETTPYFVHNQNKSQADYYVVKYTSYLSDNATLSVLYGNGTYKDPIKYATDPSLPYISGVCNQNPAYWADPAGSCADNGVRNNQNNTQVFLPGSKTTSHGLRVDFSYQLGNHLLGVGVDNMYYQGYDQGNAMTGYGTALPPEVGPFPGLQPSGYVWVYYNRPSLGGYAVRYYNYSNAAGMGSSQKAYYFQDNWQVTPNLAVVLGLRNDEYTNSNYHGDVFVDQKNQWSPRLGASWDVFGDSSLKVWGNVGRYYLALPLNVANRAANPSWYLSQYFSYTGIDSNGIPQGLTSIIGMYSPDGETGELKDPKQVTSSNLKPMYVDQINLGFDAMLGQDWAYGASLHFRKLQASLDDVCDPGAVATKMTSMGLDVSKYSDSVYGPLACRIVNPGRTSDLVIKENGKDSYITVPMSRSDWGFEEGPKRRYASVDLYFEHPFDGKWYGRVDYTYASAFGNTTGQVRPDIGQQDVSKTEDWDNAALMVGSYGELLSSRRHMLRLYGSYQFTPELSASTNIMVKSGLPQSCLGYAGPDAIGDPAGYNGHGSGNYHQCAGEVVHSGSDSPYAGHTPWINTVDMAVTYAPAFADHKLSFKLIVFNVLNSQKATITNPRFAASEHTESNFFHYPNAWQSPRSIQFAVSYDY